MALSLQSGRLRIHLQWVLAPFLPRSSPTTFIPQTGSLSALNLAAGDGMILGRLFKNLHRKEQIGSFLAAITDNRQNRIRDVQKSERANPVTMSLPAGVEQARYLKTTVQHMGDDGIVSFAEEVCLARSPCSVRAAEHVVVDKKHVLLRPRRRGR